jgi:glycosyltransferase involved in cell wall biosynthesis
MTSPAPSAATVAFVLVSYRPDEPAGMERAVAALASGLRQLGHQAVIITAASLPAPDPSVVTLTGLPVEFPCDDATLRDAVTSARSVLARELGTVLGEHRADVVVYVDALWGLGILAGDVRHPARRVLAVHVVGHDADLRTALAATHRVIAPSEPVLSEARRRGYQVRDWQVVPNPLLMAPGDTPPGREELERLRLHGPVRAVARLGPEKGVTGLLAAAPLVPGRRTEVVLADAGFEETPGSQAALLAECQALATASGTVLLPALGWQEVPGFLAGAAVTVVPSARETFGNLALESMSASTPVIAYAIGNLPALLHPDGAGPAGVLVPPEDGPAGLRRAARDLLAGPVRYHEMCGAAYCRSRNYLPRDIAALFTKAVLS